MSTSKSSSRSGEGASSRATVADRTLEVRQRTSGDWILLGSVLFIVTGIVLATYWPALSAQAVYLDDDLYLGSRLVRQPGWSSLQRIFGEVLAPSAVPGYYQPMSLASVMLGFLDPASATSLMPFHRTSLIFHLLNVALVIVLLACLFHNSLLAGLAGLLYGLHPMNADAVLWVAESKTVVSTFFALATLLFYVAYVRRADKKTGGHWKWFAAALLTYVCALLSKPTAAPVVLLLLLLDDWPLHRLNKRAMIEKTPFLIVAVSSVAVTVISQHATADTGVPDNRHGLVELPFAVCYELTLYLFKLVWPVGLVADYPFPRPFSPTAMLVGVLVTSMLAVALVFSARRARAWLTGALFFFLAISPALGVVRFTSSMAANRFMYLPMVGLLLPLTWVLNRLWLASPGRVRSSALRATVVGVATTLVLGCLMASRGYIAHWKDTVGLLQYYLSETPNEWKLHNWLGGEWQRRGDTEAAISECIQTVRLNPGWAAGQLNLGRLMFKARRFDEAALALAEALRLEPKNWQAHVLMGRTMAMKDDFDSALRELRAAAAWDPSEPEIQQDIEAVLAHQRGQGEAPR
jgi:protein O-mannosyl-transferase